MADAPPPLKRLRFTLELGGHDRHDLADRLEQLATEVRFESEGTVRSVSSMGWAWRIETVSDLTAEQYDEALERWFARRKAGRAG